MGKTGDFNLKYDQKSTLFTLEAFKFYKNQDKDLLKTLADYLYYGVFFGDREIERYRNSYNLYKLDWEKNKDYYSLYSMALMQNEGKGVKIDKKLAKENLRELIRAGMKGDVTPTSVISGAFNLGKIYFSEFFKKN